MTDQSFRIHHLPPYHLGELQSAVAEARGAGRDIIDLSQANPDAHPDPGAVEKLVQAALLPHHHRYSSSQGIGRLRESIVRYYSLRFGVQLDPEQEVVVTMGVKEGLSHLLLALLAPGESVIVPTPAYPIHSAGVFIAGGNLIGVPLFRSPEEAESAEFVLSERSNDFFERLGEQLRSTWPKPRFMVLSFPHNPTTTTVTPGFYERLSEFAESEDLLLMNDFAYGDLAFDDVDAPSLLGAGTSRSVEFYSLSKGLGLPGWRIGFCLGAVPAVQALKKIKSYLDFGVPQPLQIGAVAALARAESIRLELREIYRARRDILVEGLRSLGFQTTDPRSAILVWARLPERLRAGGSMRVSRLLLEEGGVAVCPGLGFDAAADEYVRFALVENEHRVRDAVERMKRVFR